MNKKIPEEILTIAFRFYRLGSIDTMISLGKYSGDKIVENYGIRTDDINKIINDYGYFHE
jgi:hypothetical protein